MTQEIWKPVVGHEGAYEVSNLGRVRSIDRVVKRKHWDRYSGTMMLVDYTYCGRVLRPGDRQAGHVSVAIGKGNSRDVHLLVLEAFVGPCPEGHEACHHDDNPVNNVVWNLRWGTRSSNLLDAVRNGKRPVGEHHHNAKLRAKDIPVIRKKATSGPRGIISALARKYGVAWAQIRQVRDGGSWRSIP